MRRSPILILAGFVLLIVLAILAKSYLNRSPVTNESQEVIVKSVAGRNLWNQGIAPQDPWKAIEQMHGHVGPWNVLGWKIGQKALADFKTQWGWHELDIVVYIPMETPYSCIADGVVIGTGNSIGRLDIHIAEVPEMKDIYIAVKRKKDETVSVNYKPKIEYLQKILNGPVEELANLSKQAFRMKDSEMFDQEGTINE